MAKNTVDTHVSGDGAPPAPVVQYSPKVSERHGALSQPMVERYPEIRSGVCEYCGTIDPNVPAKFQYKLCPHFRGLTIACSYCPATKDMDEVIAHATINTHGSPFNPNEIISVCNSYTCSKAHMDRFNLAKG